MTTVFIRDNTTAEVRSLTDRDLWFAEDLEAAEFIWDMGNWSCDCNRGLFFAQAAGDDDHESECGDERYTVWIEDETGKRLYEDDDAPNAQTA